MEGGMEGVRGREGGMQTDFSATRTKGCIGSRYSIP